MRQSPQAAAARSKPSAAIEQLLQDFEADCEHVALWRDYPDISEAQDEALPACEGISARFLAFARTRGFPAQLVRGEQADDPLVWTHAWVRIGTLNIDWTARQFHNLQPPPPLEQLPTPLLWQGTGAEHPVCPFRSEQLPGSERT